VNKRKSGNSVPVWVQIVSIGYLLIGSFLSVGNLFVWFMGPCPAFSSNTECHWSSGYTFWLFPGSQLTFASTATAILLFIRRHWNP
jgi:hypothetical protein